ncbi:methyl-accepting chemotaxis protein [Lachnospiraceae bacterium KM106-2]|nr:methyl-accepting chemotaxis protein [Lachnospiraceae bacterium KM106-2]
MEKKPKKKYFKQTKSLRLHMSIIFGILSIVCTSILAVALYMRAMNITVENTTEMLATNAKQAATIIEKTIETNYNMGRSIATSKFLVEYEKDTKVANELMQDNMNSFEHYDIGVMDLEGNMVSAVDGTKRKVDSMANAVKKVAKGQEVVSAPFTDETLQKLVTAYMIPVRNDKGEVARILYYLRNPDEMTAVAKTIKVLENGNCFVVNGNGMMIANQDEELVSSGFNAITKAEEDSSYKTLGEIVKKMVAGETGTGSYTYNGERKTVAYAPVTLTGWSLGINVPYGDFSSLLSELRSNAVIITILVFLVNILVTAWLSTRIASRILKLAKSVGAIAEGDFSTVIDEDVLSDDTEVGTIAKSIVYMEESLSGIITSVKQTASEINNHSTNLSAFSQELSASTSTINMTIDEMTTGNVEQANKLSDISNQINEFDTTVQKVGTCIQAVAENTNAIKEHVNASTEITKKMNDSTNQFADNFAGFSKSVSELDNDMTTVAAINSMINDIASQTNLLALNASIEAARAGEAGHGFAVVAEEIGNLAAQSRESAVKIDNIVNQSATRTKSIVAMTEELNEVVNAQKKDINTVNNALGDILEATRKVEPELDKTDEAFGELMANSNSIAHNIEDISAISEETAASSEEINASTQELNSGSGDLAESAQTLATFSNSIVEELDQFTCK